jgi:hypothetical protein
MCASATAVGDVNSTTSCGEETETSPGFRAFMPDCRAYELVSPPYIGGQIPYGESTLSTIGIPDISANGEHLLSIVFAGFAETGNEEAEGFEYGAIYEFSRTPTGWRAEALDPPSSEYPRSQIVFTSADFSRSLWKVYIPQHSGEVIVQPIVNSATLAIREPAGQGKGRFALVGPVAAPGHEPEGPAAGEPVGTSGASADLSHVLLSVKAIGKQLWPGDTTQPGGKSLYEYSGTGEREPTLVGVKNDGPLEGTSYVNEDAELVSQCGTIAGSEEIHNAQNAISADGETVYFTALPCSGGPLVKELYARVGGSRTVAISEPSATDCAACKTTEAAQEAAPEGAIFQGASEDGTKVFFTTNQELLPGAKGNGLYEYDFDAPAGKRVALLASEVSAVAAVSNDGARVYFQSTGELTKTPNSNGETAVLGSEDLYSSDTATLGAAEAGPVFVAGEPNGPVDITRDGQFAVFESASQLTGPEDTSTVDQLFEYDALTGAVVRVSVGQSSATGYECPATKTIEEGYDCDGNTHEYAPTMIPPPSYGGNVPPAEATSQQSVSEDGTVVFASDDALTPGSVAGGPIMNVYEYRAGDVYLISPGNETTSIPRSEGTIRFAGIDESGKDIFFRTASSLVPQDTDTQASFYDAREGGGFPGPISAPSCAGETCQGPLTPAPLFSSPASNTLTASGNLAPPVEPRPAVKPAAKPKAKSCKKGYVKKKGKCVKAPKSKKGKKASRASNARRTSR